MMASELVKLIKSHVKNHGDLPVRFFVWEDEDADITDVQIYDKYGNGPDNINYCGDAFEIFIHGA